MAFSVSGMLKAMETKRAGGIRKRGREPTSRSFQPECHYSGKLIQEFNNG